MKNLILFMILLVGMLVVWPPGNHVYAANSDQVTLSVDQTAPAVMVQETGVSDVVENPVLVENKTGNFFTENWIALLFGLLGFIELIVRLTPSEKDNSIFNWITALINALLPNLKKGGGTFKVSSN